MADIYTTSEDGNCKDKEICIKPFLCGYCKTDFEAFEKFCIHLESHDVHIKKYVHVCDSSLIKEDLDSCMITCMCCLGKFGNLCQLHAHILKCSGEGSYFYLHNDKRKAAYPMGSLCDFVAARSECADVESGLPPLVETNGNTRKDLNEIIKGLWLENGMTSELIKETKRAEGFKDVSMATNDLKSYDENESVTRGSLATNRSDLQQKRSRKNKCSKTKLDNLVQTVVDNEVPVVKGLWLENGMTSKLIKDTKRTEEFKDVSMATNDLKSYVENESVTRGSLATNRSDLQQKRSRKNKCSNTKLDNLVQTVVDNDGSDYKANKKSDDNEFKARCFLVEDGIANQGEEIAMCKNFEDTDEVDKVSLNNIKLQETLDSFDTNDEMEEKDSMDLKSKCNEITKKNDTVKNHDILALHNKKPRGRKKLPREVCKICGKEILQRNLKVHVNMHKNHEKRQRVCRICGEEVQRGKIKRHKNSHSTETERVNYTQRLIVCHICGKDVQQSRLKQHMFSHSNERPNLCSLCPKAFKSRGYLKIHMLSHSSVQPFYCEVCGKGFAYASSLRNHISNHSDVRPFTCDICGAGFVTKFKLKRHTLTHTGKMRVRCDLCDMTFARRENLSVHIAGVHKGERRFSCEECGKRFFTNYQLKCHYMKHSGLQPHKCVQCNTGFVERKDLRRHMRKQHNMTLDAKISPDSIKAEDILAALRQKNNEEGIVMSTSSKPAHVDLTLDQESFSNSVTHTPAEFGTESELRVIADEGLDEYVKIYKGVELEMK